MPDRNAARDWLRRIELDARFRIERAPEVLEPVNYKRGEELFKLILSGIREIYETDAIIAGGAVRDFIANAGNPKDVDVFVPVPFDKFQEAFDELGWAGLIPLKAKNSANKGVINCAMTTVQGLDVDLCFTKEPFSKDDIKAFPVFTQRAVYRLDTGLDVFPECQEDIQKKQFTIDPTIADKKVFTNVLNKVRSWQKKPEYKNWTIIEPDIKEWWEAKDEADKAEVKVNAKGAEAYKWYNDPAVLQQAQFRADWNNAFFQRVVNAPQPE